MKKLLVIVMAVAMGVMLAAQSMMNEGLLNL